MAGQEQQSDPEENLTLVGAGQLCWSFPRGGSVEKAKLREEMSGSLSGQTYFSSGTITCLIHASWIGFMQQNQGADSH